MKLSYFEYLVWEGFLVSRDICINSTTIRACALIVKIWGKNTIFVYANYAYLHYFPFSSFFETFSGRVFNNPIVSISLLSGQVYTYIFQNSGKWKFLIYANYAFPCLHSSTFFYQFVLEGLKRLLQKKIHCHCQNCHFV